MNRERILKLADVIEGLEPERFNMLVWIHSPEGSNDALLGQNPALLRAAAKDCNTVACRDLARSVRLDPAPRPVMCFETWCVAEWAVCVFHGAGAVSEPYSAFMAEIGGPL